MFLLIYVTVNIKAVIL